MREAPGLCTCRRMCSLRQSVGPLCRRSKSVQKRELWPLSPSPHESSAPLQAMSCANVSSSGVLVVFRLSLFMWTWLALLGLSCVAAPYDSDAASSPDSDVSETRQRNKQNGEIPLYRWTYFSLFEPNNRRGVYDVGAWWLAHVKPSVRLAPSMAGGIPLRYEDAFVENASLTGNHYVNYPVPPDHLVISTDFEILGDDGDLYAAGGGDVQCDGKPRQARVVSDSQAFVVLQYMCTTIRDTHVVRFCEACSQLETHATLCQPFRFWGWP